METRLNLDGDRVETLEKQLKEARELAAESDRKFEEVYYLDVSFIFDGLTKKKIIKETFQKTTDSTGLSVFFIHSIFLLFRFYFNIFKSSTTFFNYYATSFNDYIFL